MNPMPNALNLHSAGVLVTRPVGQAGRLCRLIAAQGGRAISFPTLEILAPQDPTALMAILDQLDNYDMAIFTSANAVNWTIAQIQARRDLPPLLRRVAIGKATACALERFGLPADIIPGHTFNSEALLAMPQMQAVAGQRVVIFRGEGGRELLGEILQERGAQVTYTEVYRRGKPAVNPNQLLYRWARGEIHVVTVTSNEGLQNLFDMVGERGQQWLCNTPLIVVSRRAQQLAQVLGFSHPALLSREASDEAIVETLLRWHQTRFE